MPGFYKLNSDKKFHLNSWFYKVPADGKWHPVRNAFYKVPTDNKWHPFWLYDWEIGNWSTCQGNCVSARQSRIVRCRRSDSIIVHDSFCEQSIKPITQQACTPSTCVKNFYFEYDNAGTAYQLNQQKQRIRQLFPFGGRESEHYRIHTTITPTVADFAVGVLWLELFCRNFSGPGRIWVNNNTDGTSYYTDQIPKWSDRTFIIAISIRA